MNIKSKFKLLLTSTIGVASIAAPILASSFNDFSKNNLAKNFDQTINKNNLKATQNTNDDTFAKDTGLENISTSIGPIVVNKDKKTIESRDWYGSLNWTLDISTLDTNSTSITSWEYLQEQEWLFLITDKSYLIKVNTLTGEILAKASQTESGISANSDRIAGIDFNNTLYVWSSSTPNPQITPVDRNTLKSSGSKITSTSFASEKLLDLIPLDVGYNLAISTENGGNNLDNITSLNFTLVNDEATTLIKPKEQKQETTNSIENFGKTGKFTVTELTGKYSSIFIQAIDRSQTSSKILFVGKNAYEIRLNKNDYSKTTVSDLFNQSQNKNGFDTTNNLNSAFIDSNGLIYFKKTNEKFVWTLNTQNTINQAIDLSSDTNNELKKIVTGNNGTDDQSNTNDVMIYGVPTDKNHVQNLANASYIVDPNSKFATGAVNNILKTNNFTSDQVTLTLSSSSSNRVPSQFSINDFKLSGNAFALKADGTNEPKFTIDDLTGKLELSVLAFRQAWYSNLSSDTTKSIVRYTNTFSKTSEVVKFASNDIFKALFKKKTASQISEAMLAEKGEQILVSGTITEGPNYSNVQRTFLISNVKNTEGKLEVQATFSYTNKYNTTIQYALAAHEFSVEPAKSNDYKFKFYGQQENSESTTEAIDISQIPNINPTLKNLGNYIPSLVTRDEDILGEAFIEVQDSYPIAKGIRTITIDDVNNDDGSLTVKVHYNGLAPNTKADFEQKFIGFQTSQSAAVNFTGNLTSYENLPSQGIKDAYKDKEKETKFIDITQQGLYPGYKTELASVDKAIANTYSNGIAKLSTMGYDPKIEVSLGPSGVEFGYIEITLDYAAPSEDGSRKPLSKSLRNLFNLKDGKISAVFYGFLPVSELYSVQLKNYGSRDVQNIVTSYRVDDEIGNDMLVNSLDLKGYTNDEITVREKRWDGEKLHFSVFAQSKTYKSVNGQYSFTIDWAPQFAAIRERNIILAASLTLVGIGIVSFGIGAYILRKNKMRRMLK
ncbi:hypothetical protein [Malacoplasma iowae]|uniref:hypothetical protein n=1 Tax=Malacoplasma iowae TaxID=2116 RepID=UPI003872EA8D|nr:hypothetical protein QX179_03225 [Malacoplasma iowae]